MSNCWFVLKHTHFPPPDIPEKGIGFANGAISLGHIVPDLNGLTKIINGSEKGIEFTSTVRIYQTGSWDLDWNKGRSLKAELSANVKIPSGPEISGSAEQRTKFAFALTKDNHEHFDTLDQYIIQVNGNFIGKILGDKLVAAHIERTKGIKLLGIGDKWSVYMITGIIVARGAKRESGESKKAEARTSASVNIANVASSSVAANFTANKSASISAKKSSDFVWAVKLTKIWKSATKKEWDFKDESKGATFSLDTESPWREAIREALLEELSENGDFQTIELPDEEEMIVF